eukprot:g11410.t1
MSSKTLQDLQDDELRPDGSPSRRFSRSYTQPEPSESMMGKRGGMVEVGWTFFREAAAAKASDPIFLPKESEYNS